MPEFFDRLECVKTVRNGNQIPNSEPPNIQYAAANRFPQASYYLIADNIKRLDLGFRARTAPRGSLQKTPFRVAPLVRVTVHGNDRSEDFRVAFSRARQFWRLPGKCLTSGSG
jgi:hypothetical protein